MAFMYEISGNLGPAYRGRPSVHRCPFRGSLEGNRWQHCFPCPCTVDERAIHIASIQIYRRVCVRAPCMYCSAEEKLNSFFFSNQMCLFCSYMFFLESNAGTVVINNNQLMPWCFSAARQGGEHVAGCSMMQTWEAASVP